MPEPFVFITNHTIKEGKLDHFKALSREFVDFVEANQPRPIAFHIYVDEKGDHATLVQIHPDADSMEFHLQMTGDQINEALEIVENESIQVYGTPGDRARGLLRTIAESGVPVSIKAYPMGGFARPAP